MKKKLALLVLIISILPLCACKKIKIFEEKVDNSGISVFKNTNLDDDKIYIKDGAVFMLPAEVTMEKDAYFFEGGFEDIPTLYKGEMLAYQNIENANLTSVPLIRLKSIGYTFGLFNGTWNNNQEYVFNDEDILEWSSSADVFPHNGRDIRITAMDDKPIERDMVTNGILGANMGFEYGSLHSIEVYIGTKHFIGSIANDAFTLADFEYYELENIQQTKNGYIQISMNPDMKSGYYYIEKEGIFRYVAEEKGVLSNLYDVDYYEAQYSQTVSENDYGGLTEVEDTPETVRQPEKDKREEIQTYSITVAEKKYNYVFSVSYDSNDLTPVIVLTSPNGTNYRMEEKSKGLQSVTLNEASVGEWTIKINNPTLLVYSVDAQEMENIIITKEVCKEFTVPDTLGSQKVSISYRGTITNAYVIGKNNEVTIITPSREGLYEKTFDYMEAGTYKVIVVCTEDSEVYDINMTDCSAYETETIIVE